MSKAKRITYSDSDCHCLVDIIINYKDIVECKKTDAVTWKQKIKAWEKITEIYNSLTTEPRTAEQLRCKFDNLKKEVRKYEALKRQNLYRTGGGMDELTYIKATLKLLYDKIKTIISISVLGLEPSQGDSDVIVDSQESSTSQLQLQEVNDLGNQNHIIIEFADSPEPSTTAFKPLLEDSNTAETDLFKKDVPVKNPDEIDTTPQPFECLEVKHDWSDYTPRKLQTKKHRVLQTKRKRNHDEIEVKQDEHREKKLDLIILKRKLLEDESAQIKKINEERAKKEEEIHILKKKNLELQNKKLEMEILLLKKQLNM